MRDFLHLRMRDAPLEYSVLPGPKPGTTLLRLVGPLTLTTMFEFQSWLRGQSAEVLVLDLSELSYMDSAGLGLLMNGYVSAESKGHKFLLACVSERVNALLQMTRVDQVLKSFPTVQSAMDSL